MNDLRDEGVNFVLVPRPQGYGTALEKAWQALRRHTIEEIADRKGAAILPDGTLCVRMLGDSYRVDVAARLITLNDGEAPPFLCVLILHYLGSLSSARPSGRWISFRELEGGDFYFPAFAARTSLRLKTVFAGRGKKLLEAAAKLDGETLELGDAAARFHVLPHLSIAIVLHEACEDFPHDANILFDSACKEILPTEDLAVAASMLASRVCKLA